MKLGLFVPTLKKNPNEVAASIWIRVFQMIPYYEKLGIEVSVNNPFKRYDAVIVYRSVSPWFSYALRLLRLVSKRVYFDTCVNYSDVNQIVTEKQVATMIKILSQVDGVIAPTGYILDRLPEGSFSKFLLPDPVDVEKFEETKKQIDWNKPLFVWSGVSVKSGALEKYEDFLQGKLLAITDKELSLGFSHQYKKWRHESFPKDILNGDIAFFPRDFNNTYDMGHSNFKALVFAVSGIPIIANKIPSYEKLSNDYGGIVFLEDFDGLEEIIRELKIRDRGSSRVRQVYSCETQAKRLQSFLQKELHDNKSTH